MAVEEDITVDLWLGATLDSNFGSASRPITPIYHFTRLALMAILVSGHHTTSETLSVRLRASALPPGLVRARNELARSVQRRSRVAETRTRAACIRQLSLCSWHLLRYPLRHSSILLCFPPHRFGSVRSDARSTCQLGLEWCASSARSC